MSFRNWVKSPSNVMPKLPAAMQASLANKLRYATLVMLFEHSGLYPQNKIQKICIWMINPIITKFCELCSQRSKSVTSEAYIVEDDLVEREDNFYFIIFNIFLSININSMFFNNDYFFFLGFFIG